MKEENIGEGFKFVDNDDEFEDSDDEKDIKQVEEKPKPKVRGNNLSFQDFGIPDEESDVDIENI